MKLLKLPAIAFVLIAISTHVHSQLWKQYADSAKAFKERKNYDSAIVLYTKAVNELKKDSAGTNSYAAFCDSLGILYSSQNKYEFAESLLLEAKQIKEKLSGKENIYYASTCNSLGRLYRLMGKYEKAEPVLIEALHIREKVLGTDNADYAQTCNNLGLIYSETGEYEKAEFYLLNSKKIREKVFGAISVDYAQSCNNLAILYYNTGKYEKAETLYIQAKQIRQKISGAESNDYAQSCNNLAILYVDMGEFEKGELLYLEARQIWAKVFGEENRYYAASCNNLAILYVNIGQYEKAEPLYLEARQIFIKTVGKDHPDYAKNCSNLGVLYSSTGQYKKSETFNLEAKQITEKVFGKDNPNYAQSCNNLASVYLLMKQYKKAETNFLKAKQIWQLSFGKESPDYALSCANLGIVYAKMNRYKLAEFFSLEAKKNYEAVLGKENQQYTESCLNLANLYWEMKESKKANALYTEAFQSQNTQTNKIFRFTNEAEKQSYLKKTADLENYLLSFNKSIYPGAYAGFCYDVSLFNRNLILSSSQQLRNEIYNSTDTSIKSKYNNWMNVREQLAFWYAKPVTERAAYVKELELQADSLEKGLTRLSSGFKKEQLQNENSWHSIQQNLKANEAAIEFASFKFYNGKRWTDSTYYIALLLKKNKEPEFISLFESRQLNNIIKKGDSYKTITAIYKNNKLNKAYNLIWKPIDKHLTGITKIYFAPAGLLYRISLQAMPVNYNQVLSDKYQLVQLGTIASLTGNQSKEIIDTSDKINLYGGIQFDANSATLTQAAIAYHNNTTVETTRFIADDITRDNSWQYLPGTAKEIRYIDSIGKEKNYTATFYSGANASEESIKALNGIVSPAVLHIATHGFFFADPKQDSIKDNFKPGNVFRQADNPLFRSGLLFAGANNAWKGKQVEGVEDGILTAYEVSNLYFPNTKLVVLSACETGLGDIQGNEGVYGLQRAFKIAGVENLMMSLWKVPDKETAEFMQLFYKNIFDKQSITDAFYNAQTVMKNNYRNQPYKWAAWILVR